MTCAVCHRAVNANDLDDLGRCCFCITMQPPKPIDTTPTATPPDANAVASRAQRVKARGALTDRRGNDQDGTDV